MIQKDRRPLQFEIEEVQDADGVGVTIVHCHGGGWLAGGSPLREQVRALIEQGARIRIDMADVPDIDDFGLGMLAEIKARARTQGSSKLELLNPSARILQLLQITRLDSIFDDQKPWPGSSPGGGTA